jgi:hypothetical protein
MAMLIKIKPLRLKKRAMLIKIKLLSLKAEGLC